MSATPEVRDLLERLDILVCRHRNFETARRALSQHLNADRSARCVVSGPPLVGKTKLVNEVFGGDETSVVVKAPTGASSGQKAPAMELLEAACKAGGAPMVDGFIDPEAVRQFPLPFPDWPVERPRRFGRSWESAEQVALRGFARMVEHRGHRRLVLDGAERLFDAAATRRRIAWLLGLADDTGLGLVLVCRDDAGARIVGDTAHGGDFTLVCLRRYADPGNPQQMDRLQEAVELLAAQLPEVSIPRLEGECLGKLFRHSLGCFGLLHELLRQATGKGKLERQGNGAWTMALSQRKLDGAARSPDALARLLRTIKAGEKQIAESGQFGVTGESLDVALGSYEPANLRQAPANAAKHGIHSERPGERTPTREVGNRELVPHVRPGNAGD